MVGKLRRWAHWAGTGEPNNAPIKRCSSVLLAVLSSFLRLAQAQPLAPLRFANTTHTGSAVTSLKLWLMSQPLSPTSWH